MEKQFEKLRAFADKSTQVKEDVSYSSVGWQIDHSLKVVTVICNAIKESDPKDYKAKFSFMKYIIMLSGYMPRGKAKAPRITKSETKEFSKNELLEGIKAAEKAIALMAEYDKNSFFPHPFFGHINKANTLRFLEIHTNHHIKIIQDILK